MKANSPRRVRGPGIGSETREKFNAAAEAERKTLEEALSVKLAQAERPSRRPARPR
jgi:F-type H+-transporting ATPase subunit b